MFIDSLQEQGMKTTTIHLYYSAMKTVFEDREIDVSGIELPEIDEGDINRPAYTKDEVFKLITMARQLGGVYAKAMAISTTYGVRRVELELHKPEDINRRQKTIFIRTGKGGRKVHHLIPDQIMPYLTNDSFPGVWSLSKMFNIIAESAGVKNEHAGWHGIRRSLVTELAINKVPDTTLNLFMRWKTGTMIDIYRKKTPVMDVEVFDKHPYINQWK